MANNNAPQMLIGAEAREKLQSLIKDIHIAMLTTVDHNSSGQTLRSRPMGTIEAEFDGEIWFFTRDNEGKAHDIAEEHQVNLTYSSDNAWVSVSGTARMVHDRAKMEALWNPLLKTWFPDGLETPNIALLCVKANDAEYWDSDGALAQAIGTLKAFVTRQESDAGENAKLILN